MTVYFLYQHAIAQGRGYFFPSSMTHLYCIFCNAWRQKDAQKKLVTGLIHVLLFCFYLTSQQQNDMLPLSIDPPSDNFSLYVSFSPLLKEGATELL